MKINILLKYFLFVTTLCLASIFFVKGLVNLPRTILGGYGVGSSVWQRASASEPPTISRRPTYYLRTEATSVPEIDALSYAVVDIDSGAILFEREADKPRPIASVTKLLTALTAINNINPSTVLAIDRSATQTYGSSGGLRSGEKYMMSDLLYPLLMESSNDAGEAIARSIDRKEFIKKMNEIARGIGMADSKFVDPTGLSPGNSASAKDLVRLTQYIYKTHREIFDITKNAVRSAYDQDGGSHEWTSNNSFVLEHESEYEGGKSGYTPEARGTLVSVWSPSYEDGIVRPLAIVILGAPNEIDAKYEETRKIIDYIKKYVVYR